MPEETEIYRSMFEDFEEIISQLGVGIERQYSKLIMKKLRI
jgi:hypothetical protein